MYADRKAIEAKLTTKFEAYLRTKPVIFKRSGVENNYNTEACDRLIKLSSHSEIAREMRFSPDYTVLSESDVWFFDCKACTKPDDNFRTIELEAYKHYSNMIAKKQHVRLIMELQSGELAAINPAELHFINDPTFRNSWAVPVSEDNIWRNPRQLDPETYAKWKAQFGGSGTTCAYIDLDKTPKKILS